MTPITRRKQLLLHAALLGSLAVQAQWITVVSVPVVQSEIIPVARRITWETNVGIAGGIPSPTTVFSNHTAAVTLAILQASLDACPSNQVVQLGAWTNTYNGTLQIRADGSVLRGATNALGQPVTKFTFSGGGMEVRGYSFSETPLSSDVSLTADANKGDSTVTMASVPSWVDVGELAIIDELDDEIFSTEYGDGGGQSYRSIVGNGHRGKAQLVRVVAKTSTTVTFELPLNETYRVSQTAQLASSSYDTASFGSLKRAGVENLVIEYTYGSSGAHGILLQSTDSCWLRNIIATNCPGTYHVWDIFSYRAEIAGCLFSTSHFYGGGQGYGVALYHYSSQNYIYNNIFDHLHVSMQVNYGSSGNVFAYNYARDGFSDSGQEPSINAHGTTSWQCLFEGNWCQNKVLFDEFHGSGGCRHTVFRNRIEGFVTGKIDQRAISIEVTNKQHNIIGNILGVPGGHTTYSDIAPAACAGTAIYRIGYMANINCDASRFDTNLQLLIHGNRDTVNGAQVWDSGTPNQTLPTSYYLTSKPAFFGAMTWPPFDPSSAASTNTMSYTNIPAGWRWLTGTNPASL